MSSSDNLIIRIEFLRKKMVQVALQNGFTNKESIAISQELDELLNLYQKKKEITDEKG